MKFPQSPKLWRAFVLSAYKNTKICNPGRRLSHPGKRNYCFIGQIMKGFTLVNQYAPFARLVTYAPFSHYHKGIFIARPYHGINLCYCLIFAKIVYSIFKLLFSHKKSLLLVGIIAQASKFRKSKILLSYSRKWGRGLTRYTPLKKHTPGLLACSLYL